VEPSSSKPARMPFFSFKNLAGRSKALVTAWHVYDNYRTKRMMLKGCGETLSGSTHRNYDLEESLRYIQDVYQDYHTYGGFDAPAFKDKRILEIGPGDNFGVALRFLVAGAQQVICLDRFYSERDPEQQVRIYQALRKSLVKEETARFDRAIRIDTDIRLNNEALSYVHGKGIEDVEDTFPPASFDFIISRAVLEHLYDCDAAIRVMDRLLVPGGWMVHKIDFRDHDLYSRFGFHPLTFLTISDGVYRRMSLDSGKPNRRLIDYYREKMKALGYETRLYVTHLAGQEEEVVPHLNLAEKGIKPSLEMQKMLNEIRHRLAPQFRQLPDEDLMVAGIFLVARKPC
jgi:SAM-dependent methyltransferase